MTESSERSLRAEGSGKRLRFTRRRRLRTGREATLRCDEHPGNRGRRAEGQLRSDEHRATGAASGGAPLRGHGSPACRGPRAARHRPRPRGHPNCTRGPFGSEAPPERWHGQPGQRERRQDAGPGNRGRVQLRERRSVRRQDRLEAAPSPGNRWWRQRQRSRATGNRATTGIARHAFGHDGRCVGRAKANARRSTSGGSSHLSGSPGRVRRRKQAAPPGATLVFGPTCRPTSCRSCRPARRRRRPAVRRSRTSPSAAFDR